MAKENFRAKMEAAGISEPAIRAFERSYMLLSEKKSAMIPESDIQPVEAVPNFEEVEVAMTPDPALLDECAMLKLNGGLGTSMGLEGAKTLLEVRKDITFLDLIVRQILYFRKQSGAELRFLLMNSFSTSADSRAALARYPELGDFSKIELLQNRIPKVDASTLEPAEWPDNPDLEWCPPGHGDLYAVLSANGAIDRLIDEGIRYIFVSNSDNLGATLDVVLLTWFANSGAPFMMEVTRRTASDRKGGHIALGEGKLLLRESAQCPDRDMDDFQNIDKHRFFNTNNLWLRLDRIRDALAESGGFLPLPTICNEKTVDPRDRNSTRVFQLETAMGAAIRCFEDACAVEVPRTRFAPVKTTADLLTLRSDAYQITEEGSVVLAPECGNVPPKVELDDNYRLVDQLETAFPEAVPSMKACRSLKVTGQVRVAPGTVFEGDVRIQNNSGRLREVPSRTYRDATLNFD
jgi:UDP-N-acetylglucosamine pyrophosphorylase